MTVPVSVLMPCYNAEAYVAEAVESVLNQTFTDLELIVVDDGSTDNSLSVLKIFQDPRLQIIEQDNHGQCHAANTAFKASQGQLIKFFDADDILSPEFLEKQVAAIVHDSSEIAMGEWARFYGDDPSEAVFHNRPMYRDAKPQEWLTQEWMNARPMMQCALWLIPRNILERSGGWDESLSLINDFEFFARVLLCADRIKFTPGARLFYRSGIDGSLSGHKSRRAVESAFNSLVQGTGHLLAKSDAPDVRRACANVLRDFDYTYYPLHSDLRNLVQARVEQLGGSDLEPDGPPGFHHLRKFTGWRLARRVQRMMGR